MKRLNEIREITKSVIAQEQKRKEEYFTLSLIVDKTKGNPKNGTQRAERILKFEFES